MHTEQIVHCASLDILDGKSVIILVPNSRIAQDEMLHRLWGRTKHIRTRMNKSQCSVTRLEAGCRADIVTVKSLNAYQGCKYDTFYWHRNAEDPSAIEWIQQNLMRVGKTSTYMDDVRAAIREANLEPLWVGIDLAKEKEMEVKYPAVKIKEIKPKFKLGEKVWFIDELNHTGLVGEFTAPCRVTAIFLVRNKLNQQSVEYTVSQYDEGGEIGSSRVEERELTNK